MLATIETYLPSSAEKVWEALLRRDTLLYVTRGMLGFRGRERWPDVFHQGMEIETRLVFWHLIPGWKHTLRIVRVDKESKELVSEESGGPVQKWNHRIRLEREAAQKCNYTDEVEIEAGPLTAVIWAFAQVFYRYRQMRWRRLARTL
ncbi:MAG: hypothetical protein KGY78_09710 [Anaerolineae bacterium]|nr:hypothetical protein [Anaerolineae bacterium]